MFFFGISWIYPIGSNQLGWTNNVIWVCLDMEDTPQNGSSNFWIIVTNPWISVYPPEENPYELHNFWVPSFDPDSCQSQPCDP